MFALVSPVSGPRLSHRYGFRQDFRRLAANQLTVTLDGEGPAGKISLYLIAAFLLQKRQLGFSLDTLGKDGDVQAVAECDNRANDGHGMVIVFAVADKHAVDLDFFEWKSVQVGQRRISRSEIIQRDVNAKRLEFAED